MFNLPLGLMGMFSKTAKRTGNPIQDDSPHEAECSKHLHQEVSLASLPSLARGIKQTIL